MENPWADAAEPGTPARDRRRTRHGGVRGDDPCREVRAREPFPDRVVAAGSHATRARVRARSARVGAKPAGDSARRPFASPWLTPSYGSPHIRSPHANHRSGTPAATTASLAS